MSTRVLLQDKQSHFCFCHAREIEIFSNLVLALDPTVVLTIAELVTDYNVLFVAHLVESKDFRV